MHAGCCTCGLIRSYGLATWDALYRSHVLCTAHVHTGCRTRGLIRSYGLATWDSLYRSHASCTAHVHAGCRTRGLIRSYGLATWDCLRLPPSDPGHLPLAEAVRLAELAALSSTTGSDGLRHGFEYVQVPVRTDTVVGFSHHLPQDCCISSTLCPNDDLKISCYPCPPYLPTTSAFLLPHSSPARSSATHFPSLHIFLLVHPQVSAAMPEAFAQRGWQAPRGVPPAEAKLTLMELGGQLKVRGGAVRVWGGWLCGRVWGGRPRGVYPLLTLMELGGRLEMRGAGCGVAEAPQSRPPR